ncbi:DeoR/GlpR transcriptional regulator [Actinobacillus succinogenes]|uniref:Transcriptional regulator, DeoR family n=1 Tax=Actinobacillus succinogenes (strain ATCC 55618 / DSM 22257 / CCUG 43843 / 130Z) TaxID=339671 RepID=A6VPQ7_ACTSZ|nr:DeoR/GlpR family DNA-binding transcription regulator [Actinobacillus succinogenes]ABR74954.1 transcriptional regulator, DeoR family [Actinobacillus succinogenes 130Z]PHI40635.1 DeoR/GlpR transcriptional regulator [Actinobacillus succinogenes]
MAQYSEREQQILTVLEQQQYVDNIELSRLLNCSVVTIRTAIRSLEKQGALIRTHGGALPTPPMISISLPAGNIFKDRENKLKIAEKAYQYVNDRDTIILDDSSNSFYLAQVIKRYADKYLVIITNSLYVACELANTNNIEIMLIGGLISGKIPASMGESAIDMMKNFRASKAFIGVHGVHPEIGITSIGNDQMQIKKLIFEIAKEVYVLTCSNKFVTEHLFVSAPLNRVHKIITDKGISLKFYNLLKNVTSVDVVK